MPPGFITHTKVSAKADGPDPTLILPSDWNALHTFSLGPSDVGAAPAFHDILSTTHGDTAAGAVVKGDLVFGNATPKWDRLAVGSANQILGVSSGMPAWQSQSYIDHGSLTGLADDDHPQYALLTGRAGGQILIGGPGGSDDLTLTSGSGIVAVRNGTTAQTIHVHQTITGTGNYLNVGWNPIGVFEVKPYGNDYFSGLFFTSGYNTYPFGFLLGSNTVQMCGMGFQIRAGSMGGDSFIFFTDFDSTEYLSIHNNTLYGEFRWRGQYKVFIKTDGLSVYGGAGDPQLPVYGVGRALLHSGAWPFGAEPVGGCFYGSNTSVGFTGHFIHFEVNNVMNFNVGPDGSIYTAGKVGINIVGPAAALAINGGCHVGGTADPGDNNLLVDGYTVSPTVYGGTAANDDITISGTSHATKTTSYVLLQPNGGNVGIGTASPQDALHIYSVGNTRMRIEANGAGNSVQWLSLADATGGVFIDSATAGSFMKFRVTNVSILDTTVMTFLSTGLVGIGSASPAAKLAINGGLHVGGDSDPGDNNLLVDGTATITGAFGCNSKTAQTAYASGGALAAYTTGAFGLDSDANMHALYTLVVNMRAALVANGIMS